MKTIEVFTDGSCMKRKETLGGYGIHFPNKELPDISRKFKYPPITNQRTELFAIYVAIVVIRKNLTFDKIIIYTDSEYSIKCLSVWSYDWIKNNWKTSSKREVKNQDILQPLIDVYMKIKDKVQFIHVKSHTGNKDYKSIGNAVADKLATDGSMKSK
jgi:ribonuclease HI